MIDRVHLALFEIEDFNLKESYIHPNGFLKLTLTAKHDFQRVHIWNYCETTATESTPHNHPWDFESTILHGEMRSVIFDEVAGKGYKKYLCRAARVPGAGHTNAFVGNRDLVPAMEITMVAGSHYTQDRRAIHKAYPASDNLLVSLVKILTDKGSDSVIFSRSPMASTHGNKPIEEGFLREILGKLRQLT